MYLFCVNTFIILNLHLFGFLKEAESADGPVWGKSLSGLTTTNIHKDCMHAGYPICCSSLSPEKNFSSLALTQNMIQKIKNKGTCEMTRIYHPSPYEKRQFEIASEIAQIRDDQERLNNLISIIQSPTDVNDTTIWLNLVAEHMKSHSYNKAKPSLRQHSKNYKETHTISDTEMKYLSFFNVTRHCLGDGDHLPTTHSWIEWIEPISIHTRYPSGLRYIADKMPRGKRSFRANADSEIFNTDYILVQPSSEHFHEYELTKETKAIEKNHRYFLDLGTSAFDSSLWWFTCAYSQMNIEFDHLFGWEMTLLEPIEFWAKVPPRYKNSYSFYNIPVEKTPNVFNNPFQVLKNIGAKESDYVVVKLDIDTPSIELPLALQILNNPKVNKLIDEFYFEFHYRCELLTWCCWNAEDFDKTDSYGLNFSRPSVMKYFQDLRYTGVRSHFWP